VPKLIEDFIEEMQSALWLITRRHDLPLAEKATFLRHARHTFGRTALVLSGGGALGCFHLVSFRPAYRRVRKSASAVFVSRPLSTMCSRDGQRYVWLRQAWAATGMA